RRRTTWRSSWSSSFKDRSDGSRPGGILTGEAHGVCTVSFLIYFGVAPGRCDGDRGDFQGSARKILLSKQIGKVIIFASNCIRSLAPAERLSSRDGGGTGPMKPGNRRHKAWSQRCQILQGAQHASP